MLICYKIYPLAGLSEHSDRASSDSNALVLQGPCNELAECSHSSTDPASQEGESAGCRAAPPQQRCADRKIAQRGQQDHVSAVLSGLARNPYQHANDLQQGNSLLHAAEICLPNMQSVPLIDEHELFSARSTSWLPFSNKLLAAC